MSHAARKRASRGRIQPYAWLGVGAVTLGMGAAMVGGTAVAFADTGSDSGGSSSSSQKAGSDSSKSDGPRRAARTPARGNNNGASASNPAAVSSAPAQRGGAPVVETPVVEIPAVTEPVATPAAENKPLPAAAVTARRASRDTTPTASAPAPVVDNAPAAASTPTPTPAVDNTPAADPAPAAAVAPAATDPAPSMESWLPETPIVAGDHVKLALQQIEQSQALITQETWGSGNVLAGLGSFGPQAALATAQLLLGIWASTIANAQAQVANTVGKPLIHNIAQARLQNELTYTKLAGLSLQTASALLKPLNWFGADMAPAQELVAQAQQNGKVYAKVPIQMVAGTEPVVKVKINGGSKTTLLVDTGASGLVTTADKVPATGLGPIVASGNSCFSGGLCYHYDTYNTTVDLGDGAIGVAPVNIVTDNEEYPDSIANFKEFFSWGADGILGVGANTAGPGPAPIPTAAMPGELSDGLLIYQNANLFGGGGYMILGPNLFPTKVSLSGAPDAYVKVSVNGGAKQDGAAIIDSGGVYGTLNRSLYPGLGDFVPAGTKIDVYSPDGATLLYTFTTTTDSTPYIESGLFNTGNAPYAQNPIYLNYAATPYGIGSTDFSIY